MASLSSNEQRKMAYFHTLAKVMTENVEQEVFESRFKSSHNIRINEVWSDDIAYCPTYDTAYQEYLTNSAIKLHKMVKLTPISGSNGMAYYFNDNGRFVRPWIAPTDVVNSITNLPSNGFDFKLYKQDNTQIGLTQGAWVVDYYAGIVHFGQYNTPTDLEWGNIKATFFEYSGSFGVSGITYNGFTSCILDDMTDELVFNQNTTSEYRINVSALKGEYRPSLMAVGNEDMNTLTTIQDGDLACNIGLLLQPLSGSTIEVFVNGVKVTVGNGETNQDCYFSNDNGDTARNYSNITMGDKLYWNVGVIGYNLDQRFDKISFIYLTN